MNLSIFFKNLSRGLFSAGGVQRFLNSVLHLQRFSTSRTETCKNDCRQLFLVGTAVLSYFSAKLKRGVLSSCTFRDSLFFGVCSPALRSRQLSDYLLVSLLSVPFEDEKDSSLEPCVYEPKSSKLQEVREGSRRFYKELRIYFEDMLWFHCRHPEDMP